MQTYKLNQHQHIPEIVQQFQQWDPELTAIQFSTSLIPVNRGIMMTLYVPVAPERTAEDIYQRYQEDYQEQPFIRLQPLGKLPELRQVTGTNFCDIGLVLNPMTHIVTVIAVIDNLVKGLPDKQSRTSINGLGWRKQLDYDRSLGILNDTWEFD